MAIVSARMVHSSPNVLRFIFESEQGQFVMKKPAGFMQV
jgi:hypothetical protein